MSEDRLDKIILSLGRVEEGTKRNLDYTRGVSDDLKAHIEGTQSRFDMIAGELRAEREKLSAMENKGKGILIATGATATTVASAVSAAWAYFKGGVG